MLDVSDRINGWHGSGSWRVGRGRGKGSDRDRGSGGVAGGGGLSGSRNRRGVFVGLAGRGRGRHGGDVDLSVDVMRCDVGRSDAIGRGGDESLMMDLFSSGKQAQPNEKRKGSHPISSARRDMLFTVYIYCGDQS